MKFNEYRKKRQCELCNESVCIWPFRKKNEYFIKKPLIFTLISLKVEDN